MPPYFATRNRRLYSLSLFFSLFLRLSFFFYSRADRPLIENAPPSLLFQLREYTLTESYHEDDVEVEFVSNDNLQANSEAPRGIDPNRDLNEAIAEERREMDTQRYRYISPLPKTQRADLFHPSTSLPLFSHSYSPRPPPSPNFLPRIFPALSGAEEVAFRGSLYPAAEF